MTELEPGSVVASQYQIEAKLGEGGMAVVYRAYDLHRRVRLAIKVLKADFAEDEAFVQRFRHEASNLRRLQHPNIVRFYEFGDSGGLAFMVIDFIDGQTLRTVMRQLGRPMIPGEVLGYIQPICAALGYAHREAIIHCDIKPANVMVDRAGHVFLSDFGIARLADSATVTFSTPGTAAYMAPEQWQGGERVTPATDMYAVGVMLYQLLTGQQPFTGDSIKSGESAREKMMREHFSLVPLLPSQVNPALPKIFDPLVLRCLAKVPTDRFQNAAELLSEFEADCRQANAVEVPVQPPASGGAIPAPRPAPPIPGPLAAGAVITVIGAILIVAIVIAVLAFGGGRGPGSPASAVPTAFATQPASIVPLTSTPDVVSTSAAAFPPQPLESTPDRVGTQLASLQLTQAALQATLAQPTSSSSPTLETSSTPATQLPKYEPVVLDSIANADLANDFASPPMGQQLLGGVPFQLDGRAFKSQASPRPNNGYPEVSMLSLLGAQVKSVFILIGTGDGFAQWRGAEIGSIRLEFATLAPITVPLRLGTNIREWHAGASVVSGAGGVEQVWQDPIAGHPDVTGWLDLLTIELPPEACHDQLDRIIFSDTSQTTVHNADPALTVAGLSLGHCVSN